MSERRREGGRRREGRRDGKVVAVLGQVMGDETGKRSNQPGRSLVLGLHSEGNGKHEKFLSQGENLMSFVV